MNISDLKRVNEENAVSIAMDWLKESMKNDEMYAWSWHCNIAMAAYDEGMEHKAANKAAARFMKLAFDFDVTTMKEYKDIQDYLEK